MSEQINSIERYKQIRQVERTLNELLTATLTQSDFDEGATKLGIFKNGTIVVHDESEIPVLLDFCLHDVWRDGPNAIERFYRLSPPPIDSDEMAILEAKRHARYSLFIVESVVRGRGVHARDLLFEGEVFITDISMSNTAARDALFSARLINVEGINMTTGTSLPFGAVPGYRREELLQILVIEFKKMVARRTTPQEFSQLTALIISSALANYTSKRIQYANPEENPRPRDRRRLPLRRPSPVMAAKKKKSVGPNDRCPCGSGRKLKNCCQVP